MSSRIESDKVNLGESYVINIENEVFHRSSKARLILEENKKKAGSIVEQAQEEAAKIIEAAKISAAEEAQGLLETLKEEAKLSGYNAGYETGYNEGQAAINAELTEKVLMVNNFAQNTFDIKKRIIKSAHIDILKLVIEISDKICHKKLEVDSDIIHNLTKASIGMLKDKEAITIIVNPLMREKICEITDKLIAENSLLSSIKIIEDVGVSTDGTIVESVNCRVDSRISSQIDELVQKLFNQLQSIPEDELVAQSVEEFETDEVATIVEIVKKPETVETAETFEVFETVENGDAVEEVETSLEQENIDEKPENTD